MLLVAMASVTGAAQTVGVRGTVLSPARQGLSGVVVTLERDGEAAKIRISDAEGEFLFEGVARGTYRLVAFLSGYEDFVTDLLVESEEVSFEIALNLTRFSETVMIEDTFATDVNNPQEAVELGLETISALPLPTDRFQEVFPLVPGVVRDSEGRLSFNGSRPSQSILLVNGANATDPLTGEFAVELPLRAIEAVEVNSIPYSAEYGRVSAAVARVETRGGTDEWDVDFEGLLPKLNFRDGKIKGIKAAVPQVKVSGPIKKGKLWFSQSLAYRFVRSRVYDAAEGDDESVIEGYDTLTQIDALLGKGHLLTTTLSFFPSETDHFGLNAVTTSDATPNFDSRGWNVEVSERSFLSDSVIETVFAVKRLDIAITPREVGLARLTPDGPRDNYFNDFDRESTRIELASSCLHSIPALFGDHSIKFGGGLAHTSFQGTDSSGAVEIAGADSQPLRRIDFLGEPSIEANNLQASGFVQDRWRPNERIGIDVGLRYDYDRLVAAHKVAARLSGAFVLDDRGLTVIRAGWGVFFDHVFLHAGAFEDFQTRRESLYDDAGISTHSIVFRNRVAPEGLAMPRSKTWNVELDRQLAKGLDLRVNYRERHGSREMIVDRIVAGNEGELRLSSRGASLTRELDVTLRVARHEDRELFVSYARSRSTGDLNNFGILYGNLRSPLILDNEQSLFEMDVPHRALFWGVWKLPRDIIISPGFEWRSGFPYTVFEEDYTPVGGRNRGGRFPSFLSADVRVTKGITVKGRKIRVGFQIFNLGSHFNPRDLISNLGSERFGKLLNSVDRRISLRLSLGI